jgi:hypothetical protein
LYKSIIIIIFSAKVSFVSWRKLRRVNKEQAQFSRSTKFSTKKNVPGWASGWVDGWMDGYKSSSKDCLQQKKSRKP